MQKEEVHGFRCGRTRFRAGFVDGTENPAGEETRREVAVIKDGGCRRQLCVRAALGNSQLAKLNRDEYSRSGDDDRAHQSSFNEEIDGDSVRQHLTRAADLKEDGKGLKIVRQSSPYGTASGNWRSLFLCLRTPAHRTAA